MRNLSIQNNYQKLFSYLLLRRIILLLTIYKYLNELIQEVECNNRLTQKTYPDATIQTYQYNSKGNITYAGNQYIAYNFVYDANQRLLAVTDSNAKTITYQNDTLGNRTQMTTPDGKVLNYTYDTQKNRKGDGCSCSANR